MASASSCAEAARRELDELQAEEDVEWLCSEGDFETAGRLAGKSLRTAFLCPPLPVAPTKSSAAETAADTRRQLRMALSENLTATRIQCTTAARDPDILGRVWGYLPQRTLGRCAVVCSRWLSGLSVSPRVCGELLCDKPLLHPVEGHPYWTRRGGSAAVLSSTLQVDSVRTPEVGVHTWRLRVGSEHVTVFKAARDGALASTIMALGSRLDATVPTSVGTATIADTSLRFDGEWVSLPGISCTSRLPLLRAAEWMRSVAEEGGCTPDDFDALADVLRNIFGVPLPQAFPSAVFAAMTPLNLTRELLLYCVLPVAEKCEPYVAEHVVALAAEQPVKELRCLCESDAGLRQYVCDTATSITAAGVTHMRLEELFDADHAMFRGCGTIQLTACLPELRAAERVTNLERERRVRKHSKW
eukprot:TRINITY_DN636_c0_g4_i1.p1 TRINITY_DN636_c0_g4~~TRINITY_DN636_c0_g4_i1.p1  ORF type:complete len:416 (+),score=65.77 TRINITY_DN636_c0_g4_i1:142-1389(+)